MTTLDCSSLAESSMEDGTSSCYSNKALAKQRLGCTIDAVRGHGGVAVVSEKRGRNSCKGGELDDLEEEGDAEVWNTFSKSFKQVQSVLDRNRALIQQVNENHRSKIPDNLVKNVALIQEINRNISKVVSLYSDLSSDFSSLFLQRKGADRTAKHDDGEVQLIEEWQ